MTATPAAARPRRHHRPGHRHLPANRSQARAARPSWRPGVGLVAGDPRGAGRQVLPRVGRRGRGRARVIEACMRLGRHYHFDEAHAKQRDALRRAALRRPARGARVRRARPTAAARGRGAARHRRLHPLRRPPQAQLLPDPARRHHGPHPRGARASSRTSRATTARVRPTPATRTTATSPRRRAARCAAWRRSCASPTRSTASTGRRSRASAPPSTAGRARSPCSCAATTIASSRSGRSAPRPRSGATSTTSTWCIAKAEVS